MAEKALLRELTQCWHRLNSSEPRVCEASFAKAEAADGSATAAADDNAAATADAADAWASA